MITITRITTMVDPSNMTVWILNKLPATKNLPKLLGPRPNRAEKFFQIRGIDYESQMFYIETHNMKFIIAKIMNNPY